MNDASSASQSKILFANLIAMLSTSALQQMGKLVNPMTNKAEANLEGAQLSIDMLEMLKEKTKGNLDEDESNMLGEMLANLQMNYVETARSGAPEAEASGEAPNEEPAAGQAEVEQAAEEQAANVEGVDKGKEPKFHKSYGE